MSKKRLWIEIKTDQDAKDQAEAFWGELRSTVNSNESWSETIKKDLKNFQKRLEQAIKNFPLPAAFRHAAIAVRGMIKEKQKAARKAKAIYNPDADLRLLYRIIAVDSFRPDYSPKAAVPGYTIFETIPGGILWESYLDYRKLGFRAMRLCGKTDEKWFIEAWGEPQHHNTLNSTMRALWDKYETQFINMSGKWDSVGVYRLM